MTGMHRGTLFVLTLLVAAPLVAAPPRKATPKRPSAPAPEQKLIQNCDAHKFETVVDTMVDGQPRKSKVKLCGVEGQSDAEWIGTLKDAIRKVEANKEMPGAQREQIVAAMRKANKPVEYILYSDEGHGFERPENILHYYAQVEKFLARHLGGRFEPVGEIKGHSGMITTVAP